MASDAPLYLRSLSFCNRSDFCPLHDSLASWFSSLNFHKYVDKQGKDSMRCTERQLEPLACEWWSLSGGRETFPENVPMPEEKACIPDNWFCISDWQFSHQLANGGEERTERSVAGSHNLLPWRKYETPTLQVVQCVSEGPVFVQKHTQTHTKLQFKTQTPSFTKAAPTSPVLTSAPLTSTVVGYSGN